MIGLAYIASAFFIIIIVYLIFQAVGGILLGAKIDEINVFSGSSIFKFDIGRISFKFNVFPNGASVKFTDEFVNLHPLKKLVIALFGLISYIVVAVLCIGFAETAHHISTGYSQQFWGAISPFETGSKLVEALVNLFETKPYRIGLGVFAAKFFSMNSLPLGLLSGGFIVLTLLELAGFRSERFNERFNLIGLLIILLLFLGWAIAFAAFLWRNLA